MPRIPDVEIEYLVEGYHDPDTDRDMRIDDQQIGIDWNTWSPLLFK